MGFPTISLPAGLIRRARGLFLLSGVLALAWVGVQIVASSATPLAERGLGVGAVVLLVGWWVRGYRRGGVWPAYGLLLEFGCLVVIVRTLESPQQGLNALYAAVLFRSTYGSWRRVGSYVALTITAFLVVVVTTPSPGRQEQLVDVLGQVPGMPVVGVLMHIFARTVRQHERALGDLQRAVARERVLSSVGTALARATDGAAVQAATVAAARALLGELDSGRAAVTVDLAARRAPATPRGTVVPLKTREGVRGLLAVEADGPLPGEVVDALRALGAQAALGLENVRLTEDLRRHALHDPLTGLPNRRAWDAALAAACAGAARGERVFAVALLDVDDFKAYNDRYGHQQGDRLLEEAATAWTVGLRPGDLLARYGGEEFAVLLPDRTAAQSRLIVDRLRPLTPGVQTFSAGVAAWRAGETAELVTARADRALYTAKRSGRNRVLAWSAGRTADGSLAVVQTAPAPGGHRVHNADDRADAVDTAVPLRPEAAIGRILSAARTTLGMDLAFVTSVTDQAMRFEHLAGDEGAFGWYPGLTVPADTGYCQRMLSGAFPQVIRDAAAAPDVGALPITAQAGIGAYLGVPLRLPDGRVYGALCCVSRLPRPGLDGKDAAFLHVLAGLVAEQVAALESAVVDVARIERLQPLCAGHGLTIVAQPVRDLVSGRVVGVEALSRFAGSPQLPPAAVFAEAAALGLGIPLELAAIRAALCLLPELPEHCYLSLNVSPSTIADPGLLAVLADSPAHRIVLELTEHAPVQDYALLAGHLAPLRRRGVRLAVDDAGAGFASLRHTVALDPDVIKLDLDLVRGLHADPKRQALVSAFTRYAEELGAALIAEGVESLDELTTLRRFGVPFAQGYHLGPPEPLAGQSWWVGEVPARAGAAGTAGAVGTHLHLVGSRPPRSPAPAPAGTGTG